MPDVLVIALALLNVTGDVFSSNQVDGLKTSNGTFSETKMNVSYKKYANKCSLPLQVSKDIVVLMNE